jgi:F-type H+-transporting ATPase subunit b
MINSLQTLAAEQSGGSIFGALGIDLQMLIFQGVAFLILVFILGKFIFPPLLKAVDDRQAKIEEATKAAGNAEKKAEEAQAKIEAALKTARTEAADIVATAKSEAIQMVEKAESQAKTRSERIVAEAQEDIQKDVLAARKTLEKETISLVKKAAGLAVAGIVDEKLDTALVQKSVEGAKR